MAKTLYTKLEIEKTRLKIEKLKPNEYEYVEEIKLKVNLDKTEKQKTKQIYQNKITNSIRNKQSSTIDVEFCNQNTSIIKLIYYEKF